MIQREEIKIKGIVQGVGFRPFIYSLAKRHHLNGFVLNNTVGVVIEVEGEKSAIQRFVLDIKQKSPPLAKIEEIQIKLLHIAGYKRFTIEPSSYEKDKSVLIPPDIATCDECLRELFNPEDHRFGYPFINCTNCGPRFTIIKSMPYDREKTTMHKFKMCPICQKEYDYPLNRRFHAQSNACPYCGPQVELVGTNLIRANLRGTDAINKSSKLLKEGKIIAIKGLGGFHLACDAQNERAVATLRARKYREEKPFAIMAKNIDTIKSFCEVNEFEEALLLCCRRPIVLLKKRENSLIGGAVAPKQKYHGVLLPYTPLHHLLLEKTRLILVMTSGNISDEPISYKNKEALTRLNHIADCFLINDREIHIRCDDSLVRCFDNKEMVLRRARGYVPEPIHMPFKFNTHILACGAELKNTFCLAKEYYAVVSHHIGDLENLETLGCFEQGIEHFKNLFSIEPEVIAYDLHPDYLSTKYAHKLKTQIPNLKTIAVQHHHAHITSCMAENNITQRVIGVAFDGLGYGSDGTLWGSEFLEADFLNFRRVAHFKYVPMPGGVQAIKEPYRMTLSYLYQIYGENALDLGIEFTKSIDRKTWQILTTLISKRINSPYTSSVGRLFDAVFSLIGVRDKVSYEGQAAIELEMIADEGCNEKYGYEIKSHNSMLIVEPAPIFLGIIKDLKNKLVLPIISAKFHNTIVSIIRDVLIRIRDMYGLNETVLSGGVFQNMFLLHTTVSKLRENGFRVYTHHKVPPNDGGISLGQAAIASRRVEEFGS